MSWDQHSFAGVDDEELRREKAKARQEPVIKGVLPDMPAPAAELKAEVREVPAAVAPPAATAAAYRHPVGLPRRNASNSHRVK